MKNILVYHFHAFLPAVSAAVKVFFCRVICTNNAVKFEFAYERDKINFSNKTFCNQIIYTVLDLVVIAFAYFCKFLQPFSSLTEPK